MNSPFSSNLTKISFLIAYGAAVTSHAAPVISNAAGPATGSSEVVISGSGFGTKAAPGPALFDNIDNQAAYGTVTVGKSVPVGSSYPWTQNTWSYAGAVVFSNKFPRHAGAPYHYRTSKYHGYLQWPAALGRLNPPASQKVVYLSFWYRPDADINGTGHSSKFVRIWDADNGLGTRISWTQMHLTYEPAGPSWPTWGGNTAAWNRLEILVDANKHTITAWTNGKRRHTITDFTKAPEYPTKGISVARVGFDGGGTAPPDVDSSFGEIYVDTTPARVEVCDQPEWSLCTNKEIQVAKAWSDGRITFNLARGSLRPGVKLYAYVVDAGGAASTKGAEIGGSAAAEPNPPSSVTVD